MATNLQHASHVHPLKLMELSETDGTAQSCRACGLPISSENLFGCRPCGFFLHRACALLYSPSLQHPAHALQLFYASQYSCGYFRCNICGKDDGVWNYRCNMCNFDPHFLCARMPRTVHIRGHQHALQLLFHPATDGGTYCDACRLQIHLCCYRCSSCDFDLHSGCLTKPQATTQSGGGTRSKRQRAKRLAKKAARKIAKHLLDELVGLGDLVDALSLGSEDVDPAWATDLLDGNDDFSVETMIFDDLIGADSIDDPLQEEVTSLLSGTYGQDGRGY